MENHSHPKTKWHHYIWAFLAGICLINTLPHFINGIIGNNFPSAFADPPGEGLSSPEYNILWAMINFILGYLFLHLGKVTKSQNKFLKIIFITGCWVMAFFLAYYFGGIMSKYQ
ncbi:hypothetical protein [Zunongwangia pacifica]|uniref:Uncharacterized protein n=1 Tax=Zunongwangia pacifica TaxID=2911062 RepID=A0A9X2CPP3_9FLAO|nr:hypothetical protein [Zunongwangia pacifica]MCL6220349.1 hypothetical protein [Zunongwangia pacifica]